MKITSFFKVNPHKRFEYKPRYYDPDKEEREARLQKIKEELGMKDDKPYQPDIRGKFTSHYERKHVYSHKPPLYRMVIVVLTLLLLVVVVFLTFRLTALLFYNA
ncbi:MAG: hypothetical protein ABIJ16_13750 [Bacteroidota bacterium]